MVGEVMFLDFIDGVANDLDVAVFVGYGWLYSRIVRDHVRRRHV